MTEWKQGKKDMRDLVGIYVGCSVRIPISNFIYQDMEELP